MERDTIPTCECWKKHIITRYSIRDGHQTSKEFWDVEFEYCPYCSRKAKEQ